MRAAPPRPPSDPFDRVCKTINNLRYAPAEWQRQLELFLLRMGMRGCQDGARRSAEGTDTRYVEQWQYARTSLLQHLDDSVEAELVRALVHSDRDVHPKVWAQLEACFAQRHLALRLMAPCQGRHALLQ